MRVLLIISIVVLFSSCEEEDLTRLIDDGSFEALPSEQPFQGVNPSYEFDYWELVWQDNLGNEFVHFKTGTKCKNIEISHNCLKEFNDLDGSGAGFGINKRGGHYFIRTNENGYNKAWTSIAELNEFLGHIDSYGDALLKAAAHGYYFEKENTRLSGVKKVADHFEVIAMKVMNECNPLRIDQFLLKIDKTGDIEVVLKNIFLEEASSCI